MLTFIEELHVITVYIRIGNIFAPLCFVDITEVPVNNVGNFGK